MYAVWAWVRCASVIASDFPIIPSTVSGMIRDLRRGAEGRIEYSSYKTRIVTRGITARDRLIQQVCTSEHDNSSGLVCSARPWGWAAPSSSPSALTYPRADLHAKSWGGPGSDNC